MCVSLRENGVLKVKGTLKEKEEGNNSYLMHQILGKLMMAKFRAVRLLPLLLKQGLAFLHVILMPHHAGKSNTA